MGEILCYEFEKECRCIELVICDWVENLKVCIIEPHATRFLDALLGLNLRCCD